MLIFRAVLFAALLTPSTFAAEAERMFFTPQRIEAARQNVAEHDWAKQEVQKIMRGGPLDPRQGMIADAYLGAERMVKKSDDDIFAMMPPISIARQDSGAASRLCPVHGEKIRAYSGYRPWNMDYEKHPWKVICPVGGETYPSNDFAAGDLTSGDHPDDGNGILIGDQRYPVIRYYAHMAYLNYVYPTIRSLAAAYVLTGDPRYAEKCAVLMAALANNFPGPHHHSDHCFNGTYGRRSGMVTDYIWECITMPRLALAYDAIKPIYDQSPRVLEYLRDRGLPAGNADEARQFVEDRIFRQAMQALLDEAMQGNAGHHQLAAITLALVLNDFDKSHKPNSLDMVNYTYYTGHAPAGWVMSNFVTRDGGGYEGPGYDRIKFDYVDVALRMEELRALQPKLLPESRFPRILEEPKLKAMYDFYIENTSLESFLIEIGDAGGARLVPGIIPARFVTNYPAFFEKGFRLFREPRFARALLGLEDKMPAGSDLFEPSIEADARAAAQRPEAKVIPATRLLDDYGLAYLTGGQGARRQEAAINYSALKGHYQDDFLALYLFAHEIAMLPDLGYPFTWDYRWQWDSNIYTHNTVAVDGAPPITPPVLPRGWTSLVGDAGDVHAAIVAHDCYNPQYNRNPFNPAKPLYAENHPPVDRYERITVMIGESEADAYLLDLFVVEGGMRHDQSWHSVLREPALPELAWQAQESGTAAGPEVPFDGKYVNIRGREVQDGLCYVTSVQRARASIPATFDWDFQLSEPAGLRLHIVPVDGPVELIYGRGRSPARPETWGLPLLFVRREGPEGLQSRFLTLLEPYRGDAARRLGAVRVEGQSWPLTITIERGESTDVVTLFAPSAGGVLQRGKPRDVGVRVVTSVNGEKMRDVQFGALAANGAGIVRGKIVALDRDANTITIDQPIEALADAQPWVRIHSPGRSSMYRIIKMEAVDPRRSRLTLKETSLLSRALPLKYESDRIVNGAPTPFATGSVDEAGNYVPHSCRFEGARVENARGTASLRLAGVNGQGWITGMTGYDLFLEKSNNPRSLTTAFGPTGEKATPLPIYDYGNGDAVEFVTRD